MRTTLSIDDQIIDILKKRAYESGRSFKEIVNETLRAGLQANQGLAKSRPYVLQPHAMGEPKNTLNLDKSLALADLLEIEALGEKLDLRK